MRIIPLNEALSEKGGQTHLASIVPAHQTAISKAHRAQRNIFIMEDNKGITAFEIKPVFNTNPDLSCVLNKILSQ